jgi:hypothetical protein
MHHPNGVSYSQATQPPPVSYQSQAVSLPHSQTVSHLLTCQAA